MDTMRLPGFTAETSLYKTIGHYRTVARFGQADGSIYPMLSLDDLVKSSLDLTDLIVRFSRDLIYVNRVPPISVRGCCQRCLSSIPCADESCRRQRSFSCTRRCGGEVIGGCECLRVEWSATAFALTANVVTRGKCALWTDALLPTRSAMVMAAVWAGAFPMAAAHRIALSATINVVRLA